MLEQIEKLRADSKILIENLASNGIGDFGLGNLRLELLIEHLMPWSNSNTTRLQFEMEWEQRANNALREAQEQVSRMKLTQGVPLIPNLNSNGLHG